MGDMSTIVLSAFSACVLCLLCTVLKRRNIKLILELEYYLECQEYRKLAEPIRAINKSFTPVQKREIELDFIRSWSNKQTEFEEIIQQEHFLLEEKDVLEKQTLIGTLDPNEEAFLAQITKDLKQVKPRVWKIRQNLADMRPKGSFGSWLLEFSMVPNDLRWEEERFECSLRLGCCERGCGCCEKPRKGRAGQTLEPFERSHCMYYVMWLLYLMERISSLEALIRRTRMREDNWIFQTTQLLLSRIVAGLISDLLFSRL